MMHDAPPTFRLTGLTYDYRPGPRGQSRPALSGVTADIPAGSVGVLGLSGSGKTTLLNIFGLLAGGVPGPGQVTYTDRDGKPRDYATLKVSERVALRRDEFGFVLQTAFLLPHLSCLENAAVPLAIAGLPYRDRTARVEALFQAADPSGGLFALRHRRPRDVSGGERQRVAVLRAVAHDPRVLFADEPFSSLDPVNTQQILRLLAKWQSGELHPDRANWSRSLLLVSHSVRETVAFTGGRCLILRAGAMIRNPNTPVSGEEEAIREMGGLG